MIKDFFIFENKNIRLSVLIIYVTLALLVSTKVCFSAQYMKYLKEK